MALMDTTVGNRILKLINSHTVFSFNVPLSHSAVLRSTKQIVAFKREVVDSIQMANQWLKLTSCNFLLIVCYFPVANQSITISYIHPDNFVATKAKSSYVLILLSFFKRRFCVQDMVLCIVLQLPDFFSCKIELLVCWLLNFNNFIPFSHLLNSPYFQIIN